MSRRVDLQRRTRLAFGLWVLALVVNLLVRPQPPPAPVSARAAAQVGWLLRQGKGTEAAQVAERVLAHPGAGPRTRLIVAACYLRAGEARVAEAVSRRDAGADPETSGLRFVLVEALRRLGHVEEAAELALRYAAAAPLDPGLGFQAARIELERGKAAAARARLEPLAEAAGRGYLPVRALLARILLDAGEDAGSHVAAVRRSLPGASSSTPVSSLLARAIGAPAPDAPR